jgi:hypothetical protein
MDRTKVGEHDTIACVFCPHSAFNVDGDGNLVCITHYDEPMFMPLPHALPDAHYRYLGRTRTKERARENWPTSTPRVTDKIGDYFYSWQLLPKPR